MCKQLEKLIKNPFNLVSKNFLNCPHEKGIYMILAILTHLVRIGSDRAYSLHFTHPQLLLLLLLPLLPLLWEDGIESVSFVVLSPIL